MDFVSPEKFLRNCAACGETHHSLLEGSRRPYYGFDNSSETFHLIRCENCKLVSLDPKLTPEDLRAYYSEAYYGRHHRDENCSAQKFSSPLEWVVQKMNLLRARKLLGHLEARRAEQKSMGGTQLRILDIGCGRGTFVKALARAHPNIYVYGTEMHGFQLPKSDANQVFLNGNLEELKFESGFFDAVCIWHVLEHIQQPVLTVQEISRILKPGGLVHIAVPNFASLQSAVFRENWFHLDLPRHLFHFTEKSLRNCLEKYGLFIEKKSTQSWDQNLFGFLQSALNASVSRHQPNFLYEQLKKKNSKHSPKYSRKYRRNPSLTIPFFGHLLAGFVFACFGVFENVFSVLIHRGASLTLLARKS